MLHYSLIENNFVLIIAVFAYGPASLIVILQAPSLFLSLKQLKYLRHLMSFKPGVFFTNAVRILSAVKKMGTLQQREIFNSLL